MIISDLYQTKIECMDDLNASSYYEVDVDSEVVVVVSLLDFNGEAVTGKNVTLTVNGKGQFTALTSSSSDYDSMGSVEKYTVKGVTNGEGKVAVKYTASEFGLVTFCVNGVIEHIKVGGSKLLKTNSTHNYELYEFEDNYGLYLNQLMVRLFKDSWTNITTKYFISNVTFISRVSCVNYATQNSSMVVVSIVPNKSNGVVIKAKSTRDGIYTLNCWLEWSKL